MSMARKARRRKKKRDKMGASESERELDAYHEAAHAVRLGLPLASTDIQPARHTVAPSKAWEHSASIPARSLGLRPRART